MQLLPNSHLEIQSFIPIKTSFYLIKFIAFYLKIEFVYLDSRDSTIK